MLKLIASNHIKEDAREEFLSLAKELIAKSRAEEGNVSYTINVSLDDPCLFTFVEVWKDQAAFDTHSQSKHFVCIFPKVSELSDSATPPTFYQELEA
ncbi:MAG: putative quinol monooxygenase [Atopobiaceae bacterium]